MKTKFGVLLALLIVLSGCSAISTGTVTAKTYYEPYTWTETVYNCYARDKNGACTMNIPSYITHNEPERFKFDLKKGKDTGWVYVDGGTYQSYDVGDRYPRRSAQEDEEYPES